MDNPSGINPTGTPSSLDVYNASNDAISFKEQLPNLAQKLREVLTAKFAENPLFAQRETAMQGFLNAPSQARADISKMQTDTGVPLSPTQQQAIESSRRSAAFAPLSTSSSLLSASYGGLDNIVKSGTDAFTSAANAQGERANLLNTLRQQEIERQFKEKQLSLGYAKLNKTGAINKAQQTAMLEFSQIPTILQQLQEQQSLARGRTTGFISKLKGMVGIQPDVSSYESYKNAVATPIARVLFGEKGNLSDTDIKRAVGLLPSVADTPEEATRKLTFVKQLADSKYNAILQLGSLDSETSEWEIVQ